MENNIENQLKKHFHNREIEPNPALWKILESKLDTQKNKKEIHLYKWLAYASIFIGILFAIAMFFKRNKVVKKENFITKEKVFPQIKNKKIQKDPTFLLTKKTTENAVAINQKKTADGTKNKIKTKHSLLSNNKVTQQIALNKENKKLPEITSEKENISQSIQNIAQQKNEIQKQQTKKHLKPLSDSDLDALLTATLTKINQKDTAIKKINIKTNQVLYVLENESNIPLKNKIIKSLIAGAQAVDNHLKNN